MLWFGLGVLLALTAGTVRAQAPDETAPVSEPATINAGQATAAPDGEQSAPDPPSRVVRLGVLQGEASVEPAGMSQFVAAELNQVLTSGDRLYLDPSATAELQTGQIALRVGGGTDLTVSAMTDQLAQFGLAGGSLHLRSYALSEGTVLELDSPEAAITVLQPGDVRVDEDASTHATTIAVLSGQVQVDGPGFSQQMSGGESLRVHGADPSTGLQAYVEPLSQAPGDRLDRFAEARDSAYATGLQASADFVNPDTTGLADLADYGSWDAATTYGPVWFPVVAVTWRPYCDGHWAWVAPWGWTWVGAEPWGFAPSHYGRWVQIDGRWGWLPGTRPNKPVYAPAMVAFVGGRQFSASLGFAPGAGVAAWFPLGPREPYAPWYHGSTLYLNRVNASNLYNANIAEARAFYNQRAVSVYVNDSLPSRSYVNRGVGTVAISQASFLGGQPVARNQIRLSSTALAQAPVLTRSAPLPGFAASQRTAARVVPPAGNRPTLPGQPATRPAGDAGEGNAFVNRPVFVRTHPAPAPPTGNGEQRNATEPVHTPGLGEPRVVRPVVPGDREPSRSVPAPARAPEPPRPAPAASPSHR
jgi:hypothetical protein